MCSLCERPVCARGWCTVHYQRWRAHGDPLAVLNRDQGATLLEAFSMGVPDGVSAGECWEWSRGRFKSGYGSLQWKGGPLRAHRVAYELYFADLLPDEKVRHRCDNKPCVNPHHLESGSMADNTRDALERGQIATGDDCPWSKLTSLQVVSARKRKAEGESIASIARDMGVNRITLSNAIRGITWKHL